MHNDSLNIRAEIEKKFGFFPPFFEPALDNPEILRNLWQQTIASYLDNPLPALFKEKLAALLGRYCAVPYCLACHASALRPLGMSAAAVLELLKQPALSFVDLAAKLQTLDDGPAQSWPAADSVLEQCVLSCCVAIYLRQESEFFHAKLRHLLLPADYTNLVVLLTYNQTCLAWAEAHPELSYEKDGRAQAHLQGLVDAEPELKCFFWRQESKLLEQVDRRNHWVTDQNRLLLEEQRQLRRQAEADRAHMARLLNQAERERELRTQFVAMLTHDLRTPLSAAQMSAELIIRRSDDVRTQQRAQRIVRSVQRADQMIQDLLDASRVHAGEKLKLDMAPTDLKETVEELVGEFSALHGSRFELVSDEQVKGVWHEPSLRRVVENLVTNALKYGAADGKIRITLQQDEHTTRVAVHNVGNPISVENQARIFEFYQRAGEGDDGAHSETKKGWGLGLPLVHGVAVAHGGGVELDSTPLTGTTFTLRLPTTSTSHPDAVVYGEESLAVN